MAHDHSAPSAALLELFARTGLVAPRPIFVSLQFKVFLVRCELSLGRKSSRARLAARALDPASETLAEVDLGERSGRGRLLSSLKNGRQGPASTGEPFFPPGLSIRQSAVRRHPRNRANGLTPRPSLEEESTMRFMIMVPATKETEAGILPTGEEFAEMGKFAEEMVKAGVMLDGAGLRPTSLGARVKFGGAGKRPQVIDGPFTESKELLAGFWLIQVRSRAEAIEWASRAPFPEGIQLEIRQLFEDDDFAPSDPTGELRAKDAKLREELARKA